MTVIELIEELKKHPPDMMVIYEDYEQGQTEIEYISQTAMYNYSTKKDEPVILVG